MNLVELLGRLPAEKLAIEEPSGRRISFGELERRSAALAGGMGLQPGDRVVVLHPVAIPLYEILLACFRALFPVILVDPAAQGVELARLKPRAFAGSWKAQLLRLTTPGLRGLDRYYTAGWMLEGPPLGPLPAPEALPALLTFTTGSTGRPKVIARSHAFLDAQRKVLSAHMDLGPDDVDLPTLPVFLLNSLAAGASCLLPDCDLRAVGSVKPERVMPQLRRVTTASGSPAFFAPIARHMKENGLRLGNVRKLFTGGARVPPALVEALLEVFPNARVEIIYGSTEAEPIATLDGRESLGLRGVGACAGRPVEGLDLRIVDDEILVAGAHVNPGYFEDPEADDANKVREGRRIWHRTGDAGRLDDQGRLWLLGRVKDRVAGLFPFPVEEAAEALPGVVRAALIELDGAPVLAFSGEARPEAVAEAAGVPRAVRVSEMPLDHRHNAKVDRARLLAMIAP